MLLKVKTKNRNLLILLVFLYITSITFAAAPPPPPPPPSPGCWPPPCIPIDGGVSILLLAGAMYGAKKSYDKFRTRKDKEETSNAG